MSIENDIIEGKIKKIKDNIENIDNEHIGSLFLLAVSFEQEEIAKLLLDKKNSEISSKIICEAFRSAAAHNEASLITNILGTCPEKVAKEAMIDAARMATSKSYIDIIEAIAKDKRGEEVLNYEDKNNPHIIMQASDIGDYWFIEKLVDLPKIKIKYHHVGYAYIKHLHKISNLLKHKIINQSKHLEQRLEFIDQEKDMMEIGPHVQHELEKRKHLRERGVLK